jgi:hypothetical protein
MVFNQTARTPDNLGLFGGAQKLARALGRNRACSTGRQAYLGSVGCPASAGSLCAAFLVKKPHQRWQGSEATGEGILSDGVPRAESRRLRQDALYKKISAQVTHLSFDQEAEGQPRDLQHPRDRPVRARPGRRTREGNRGGLRRIRYKTGRVRSTGREIAASTRQQN